LCPARAWTWRYDFRAGLDTNFWTTASIGNSAFTYTTTGAGLRVAGPSGGSGYQAGRLMLNLNDYPQGLTDFEALASIVATGSGIVTCSVPMCYRVVATLDPPGMIPIPGGTNSGTDPDIGAYSLTVGAFFMDATEVTKVKWDEVCVWAVTNDYGFDNAGAGKVANHPVRSVNWYDAVKWCNARSQMEGRPAVYTVDGAVYKTGRSDAVVQTSAVGYRLPTDVEWAYAARGGLSGKRFPWGDTITHDQANYNSPASYSYDTSTTRGYHPAYATGGTPYTSPVGSFEPNGYGLCDMAGNVYEWCFDWCPGYVGSDRVLRGGNWANYANYCRPAFRNFFRPYNVDDGIGFRAVLSAQ